MSSQPKSNSDHSVSGIVVGNRLVTCGGVSIRLLSLYVPPPSPANGFAYARSSSRVCILSFALPVALFAAMTSSIDNTGATTPP